MCRAAPETRAAESAPEPFFFFNLEKSDTFCPSLKKSEQNKSNEILQAQKHA